jgi:hypothetical protein
MFPQTRQDRCITGSHVWVVMALALGLVLGPQAAAAKECQQETPLPADVRLCPGRRHGELPQASGGSNRAPMGHGGG